MRDHRGPVLRNYLITAEGFPARAGTYHSRRGSCSADVGLHVRSRLSRLSIK